jgi:hypothetical protein
VLAAAGEHRVGGGEGCVAIDPQQELAGFRRESLPQCSEVEALAAVAGERAVGVQLEHRGGLGQQAQLEQDGQGRCRAVLCGGECWEQDGGQQASGHQAPPRSTRRQ